MAFKANSKKERTAKALEQQNRMMKEQLRRDKAATIHTTASAPKPMPNHLGLKVARTEKAAPGVQARAAFPKGVDQEIQPAGTPESPVLIADELTKLATLRDEGILTAEEFDSEKARLLAL